MTSATQIIRRRRNRKQRRLAAKNRNQLWLYGIGFIVLITLILPIGGLFGISAIFYLQAADTLPTPAETIDFSAVVGATRLYDRSGQTLIYAVQDPLGDERTWVTLDELPDAVIDATLLVEDQHFLQSAGFDMGRTVARLWRNLLNGPIDAESSLTGRLVRNAIAPPPEFVQTEDRTREIVLVAEINRRYSPTEILEWHLNTNYYGNEAYGIEAAAQVYLGKSAHELTLDEAALLAAIPTAPQFNPIDNELAARGRQSDTLRQLLVNERITQADFDLASRQITVLLPNAGQTPEIAPDFALYARKQAETILSNYGLNGGQLVSRGGLKITTSLDLDLYYQADCVLRSHLDQLDGVADPIQRLDGAPCDAAAYLGAVAAGGDQLPDQGLVVVLDAQTGVIEAMVGAATRAAYQPGVTLYPFVYFEGFRGSNQGTYFTPATMVLDIPVTYPGQVEGLIYQPANPDARYRGPVSVREAIGQGLVAPVVEVANKQGLSNVLRSAHRLGINSLDAGVYHISLLGRGGEVALLDLAYAYSVLASMGDMHGIPRTPYDTGYRTLDPVAVLRIEDADGKLLWAYDAVENRQNIFSDARELGYLVNDVFADNRYRPASDPNPLNTDRPAAVVNGLTVDKVDNWTIGYTPQRVIGVHLGRADAGALSFNDHALNGAAPVWKAVLEYSHQRDSIPPTPWERPSNIIEMAVCERSGLLPNGICPTYRELFISGIAPTAPDTYWQSFKVNSQTGQLATANTPAVLQDDRTYFVPPDAALEWWQANRLPLPPTALDVIYRSPDDRFGATAITEPIQYAYLKGVVPVRGNVNTDNLQYYQVAYGQDWNPSQWTRIGEQQTTFTPDQPLVMWDTGGLDGIYTLELTAVLQGGSREYDTVQVRIDNTPPTVILSTSEAGKIYRFPDDQVVKVVAEVRDNFSIERVEFYHDGRLVLVDTEFPYEYDYGISGVGVEYFRAVVFDAAGNRSESNEIQVEVRR